MLIAYKTSLPLNLNASPGYLTLLRGKTKTKSLVQVQWTKRSLVTGIAYSLINTSIPLYINVRFGEMAPKEIHTYKFSSCKFNVGFN